MPDATSRPHDLNLYALLESFLDHLACYRKCSPLTVRAYKSDGETLLRWLDEHGVRPVPTHLDEALLLRYLGDQGHLSANTIRRRVHAISAWCEFMARQGLLDANPVRGLPLPKRRITAVDCPTVEEVRRLLDAARIPLERAVVSVLAGMGLRRAELLGLDLEDLSADLSEARVRGKGDRERTVPIPYSVQQTLREYLEVRGREAGPLFVSRVGTRLGVTSLRRLFSRLLRRAGLERAGYSLHSMRHGYATQLLRSGADVAVVRDLMGHASLATLSIYAHSDPVSRRAAVDRLPVAASGGGGDG